MKIRPVVFTALLIATISAQAGQWRYQDDMDQMTGKASHIASIDSNNSLDLSSPYSGQNNGHLFVRKHPKYGTDVIFSIDKGQLLCRTYDPCDISVKFDGKAPMKFKGVPPADHDSTTAFLSSPLKFIANARKAKKILVQVTIYRSGSPILEFTSPVELVWTAGK
jgi:hypothetical protein